MNTTRASYEERVKQREEPRQKSKRESDPNQGGVGWRSQRRLRLELESEAESDEVRWGCRESDRDVEVQEKN